MPTPTYATVIGQINTYIVANGNNAITANILNPILKLLIDFSNNTIGDLSTLTTDETSTIVDALNSLKDNINNINDTGVKLFTGFDDPNLVPPALYDFADFYMQLLVVDNTPIDLWQFNGVEWISTSQDNIRVIAKTATDVSVGVELIPIWTKVNALPTFEVTKEQILTIENTLIESTIAAEYIKAIELWSVFNVGKGFYGVGGTQLTANNFTFPMVQTPTVTDYINLPTTDVITIADLTGLNIAQFVNAKNPYYEVQDGLDGNTLFATTEGIYLFKLGGGNYGVGGITNTTLADYELLSNTATAMPIDATVIENSPNAVSGGGVFDFVQANQVVSVIEEPNANRTAVLSDANSFIAFTPENVAKTYTIPLNSSVAFPIGTQIRLRNPYYGTLTVSGSVGVNFFAFDGLVALSGSIISLIKTGTNTWNVNILASLGLSATPSEVTIRPKVITTEVITASRVFTSRIGVETYPDNFEINAVDDGLRRWESKNILRYETDLPILNSRDLTPKSYVDTAIAGVSGGGATPNATTTVLGKAKLFTTLGTATDGAVDQNTLNTALNLKANTSSLGTNAFNSTPFLPLTGGTLTGVLYLTDIEVSGVGKNKGVRFGTYANIQGTNEQGLFIGNNVSPETNGKSYTRVIDNIVTASFISLQYIDGSSISFGTGINGDISTPQSIDSGTKMRLFGTGNLAINKITDNLIDKLQVNGNIQTNALVKVGQFTTATEPAYVKGAQFFNTTLNKMRIGGATAYETVTSS